MKQLTATPSSADLAACTVIAVDLAKRVFQVAGEDALGKVHYEHRIKSREAFTAFLNNLPVGCTVLMETGPGAQSWARQVIEQDRNARILPAQHVEDHRSGAKNDRNDALAILRAGRDSCVKSVPIKSVQALAMQALHRIRQGYISRRTALGNQMRGLLLEHGIAMAQGHAAITRVIPVALQDQHIPELLRELIADLLAEWEHLAVRIEALTGKLQVQARQDAKASQLMSTRGIGPVIATALIAKQTQPERFNNARQFAAYFGAVPDQKSSGQKVRLGKMSKRGDGYLRSLMIEGAHAVLRHLDPNSQQPDDRRLLRWMQRHGRKGAAIRLANRNFRIVWVMLQSQQGYCRQPQHKAQPCPIEEIAMNC